MGYGWNHVHHFVFLIPKLYSPYNTIPYPLLLRIFHLMVSMFNSRSRSQDTGFDLRVRLIKIVLGFYIRIFAGSLESDSIVHSCLWEHWSVGPKPELSLVVLELSSNWIIRERQLRVHLCLFICTHLCINGKFGWISLKDIIIIPDPSLNSLLFSSIQKPMVIYLSSAFWSICCQKS